MISIYIVNNLLKAVFHLFFNFQVKIGANVAKINEQNNKDCEMYGGKKSVGNINPTNKDLVKSGFGNNSIPATKPIIIDI